MKNKFFRCFSSHRETDNGENSSIWSLAVYVGIFLTLIGLALFVFFPYVSAPITDLEPLNNTSTPSNHTTQTAEAKRVLTVAAQTLNTPSQAMPSYTETPIITSTVFTCQKALNVRVKVGDKARVIQSTTRLRSKPEVSDSNIIFLLAEQDELKIIDGPVCSPRPGRNDFYVFWKVVVPTRSLEGWVAEGDSNYYYIEPNP